MIDTILFFWPLSLQDLRSLTRLPALKMQSLTTGLPGNSHGFNDLNYVCMYVCMYVCIYVYRHQLKLEDENSGLKSHLDSVFYKISSLC